MLKADKTPHSYAFVYDAKRFPSYNRFVIEQAPLQLYCSAIVFAPEKSIVRSHFKNCIPAWIQRTPRVQANWSIALQMLKGHTSSVTAVIFSPDGNQVVSGSWDRTIWLLDAMTRAALQTLESHGVTSVVFSPDGKLLPTGNGNVTLGYPSGKFCVLGFQGESKVHDLLRSISLISEYCDYASFGAIFLIPKVSWPLCLCIFVDES